MSKELYHGKPNFVGALFQLEQDAPLIHDGEVEVALSLTTRLLGRLQLAAVAAAERRSKAAPPPAPAPAPERLISVKAAAERLSMSPDWIYTNAQRLPFIRREGRVLRAVESLVDQYIHAGRPAMPSTKKALARHPGRPRTGGTSLPSYYRSRLEAHFRIEDHPGALLVFCDLCGKRWRLPTTRRKIPSSTDCSRRTALLDHAASHSQPKVAGRVHVQR